MNEADLAARGQRADQCYSEFIGPILRDCRAQYADRIADIAVQELNPAKRAEKITALATAMKILDNIDNGIRCVIEDGKIAQSAMLRVEEIDKMTATRKRLFEFMPY